MARQPRRRPAPVTPVRDVLADIDAATDQLCACGCGQQLDPAGPSAWYVDGDHQRTHAAEHATNPDEVWLRPDAAQTSRRDDQDPPLTDPHLSLIDYVRSYEQMLDRLETQILAGQFNPPRLVRQPDPDPGPAYCNSFEPAPEHGPAALRFTRWCATCRQSTRPKALMMAVPDLLPLTAEPTTMMNNTRMVQGCSRCYGPFPAPALYSAIGYSKPERVWQLVLTDEPPHANVAGLVMYVSERLATHSQAGVCVWRELQLSLEHRRRPACSVSGCAGKGRNRYEVKGMRGSSYRGWDGERFPVGTTLTICAAHEGDVLRDPDNNVAFRYDAMPLRHWWPGHNRLPGGGIIGPGTAS